MPGNVRGMLVAYVAESCPIEQLECFQIPTLLSLSFES